MRTTCTTCNSDPVPSASSTAASSAREASGEPSVASSILVGKMPRLLAKCYLHIDANSSNCFFQCCLVNLATRSRPRSSGSGSTYSLGYGIKTAAWSLAAVFVGGTDYRRSRMDTRSGRLAVLVCKNILTGFAPSAQDPPFQAGPESDGESALYRCSRRRSRLFPRGSGAFYLSDTPVVRGFTRTYSSGTRGWFHKDGSSSGIEGGRA